VSRLCDRVMRQASPGLDTHLSGLGLGFIYLGNVGRAPDRSARRIPPYQQPHSVSPGFASSIFLPPLSEDQTYFSKHPVSRIVRNHCASYPVRPSCRSDSDICARLCDVTSQVTMKGLKWPAPRIHPNVAHRQLETQPSLYVTAALHSRLVIAVRFGWNGVSQASEHAIRARLP
jgi:hypothetical protein